MSFSTKLILKRVVVLQDAFSLGEDDKMEEKMAHLALARDADSPQFSIKLSHSPESSPEPVPEDSKYGTSCRHCI